MDVVNLNGVDLEVEARGAGEPVLLIHGSIISTAFQPLIPLAQSFRLLDYHRQGFGGSHHPSQPISIAEQAADARAVMRHFGVERAHVVGHSYGGAIALQFALDYPEASQSLALLEPALMMVPSAQQFFESMGPIVQAFEAGDKTAAIDGFSQAVVGPDYQKAFGQVLPPGWFEDAVADADTLFRVELPALQQWQFSQELAGRISQPVLAVLGAESAPLFVEGHDLLREWLPQAEPFVLPQATHALQMMNPAGMAAALSAFFTRHPLSKRGD